MNQTALLGNDALRQQVTAMLRRGALSHCLLLAGPEGSGKSTLARYLAMALQCADPQEGIPCGVCAECRRVAAGIHPDVIAVDYEQYGKSAHYKGQVAYIRGAVCADAAIRPNQGRRKIYHLLQADTLNPNSQNALLKLIEEPPAYGVFLLESRNPDLLLPTVRSRATELRMEPLPAATLARELAARFPQLPPETRDLALRRCDGWLGQALALAEGCGARCPEAEAILQAMGQPQRRAALLRACVPLEKYKRDQLQPVLEQLREGLAEALAVRSHAAPGSASARALAGAVTARALAGAAQAAQLAQERLQANVSAAHVMGALAVQLAALAGA